MSILAKINMRASDFILDLIKSNEISTEGALLVLLDRLDRNEEFIDSLIEKYSEQKRVSYKNLKLFKNSDMYNWYDCSFNSCILMIHDLEDIKCRLEFFKKD